MKVKDREIREKKNVVEKKKGGREIFTNTDVCSAHKIPSLSFTLSLTVLTDDGMRTSDVRGWMDGQARAEGGRDGERDDISAESVRGQSPRSPLPAVSALPHLSLVATAAAPSLLCQALFGVGSNAPWCVCVCVCVLIWSTRGCNPAQVITSFFCTLSSVPHPPFLFVILYLFLHFIPALSLSCLPSSISPSLTFQCQCSRSFYSGFIFAALILSPINTHLHMHTIYTHSYIVM